MNMLKFGCVIVLVNLPDIPEFYVFFFLGSGRPQTKFSSNVVFICQKSLNVWKDICLEAKHVGALLMDQLKKKGVMEGREKINHLGCLLSQILIHCFVCLCICIFYSITQLCPYYVCSNPIMIWTSSCCLI